MESPRDMAPWQAALRAQTVPVLGILAVLAVASCVLAALTGTYLFLLAPMCGAVSMLYAAVVRSVGGALLGFLELLMPFALFLVVSRLIAAGIG